MARLCHYSPLSGHWLAFVAGINIPLIVYPRTCSPVNLSPAECFGAMPYLGLFVESEEPVQSFLQQLWSDERGQDIAEYAVMLAVILVIVIGTVRLIGTNSNTVFSQVASGIQ